MRLSINGRFGLTGATVMGWIALAADSGEQELSFVGYWGPAAGTWDVGARGWWCIMGASTHTSPRNDPSLSPSPETGVGGVSEQKKGDGRSLEWLKERSQICGAPSLKQGQPCRSFSSGTVPGGSGVY